VSFYPATALALNKGKYYVLLTIPVELRAHCNGRKPLKQCTDTSDPQIAKRKQHNTSSELVAKLDACKPDPMDVISDLLGWNGDADDVQRMDDRPRKERDSSSSNRNCKNGRPRSATGNPSGSSATEDR